MICKQLRALGLSVIGLGFVAPVAPASAFEASDARFTVEDHRLIYDTEAAQTQLPDEIIVEDIESFREILQHSPDVTELQLNSSGGSIYAASEIAWIVADFGLDTLVVGECVSACVDIFLAGAARRMALGSKIGFHRRSWSPVSVEDYYTDLREAQGWETPFVFGAWIYEDTQREVYDQLVFLMEQGVDAEFAIHTFKVEPGDEWYPTRLEMIAAGVLRDAAP